MPDTNPHRGEILSLLRRADCHYGNTLRDEEDGWAADYARTADGLPYIGAHRNYPWHLFAFGDSSHSVTGAYLASRVLLRQYFDQMDPADEVFGFHR